MSHTYRMVAPETATTAGATTPAGTTLSPAGPVITPHATAPPHRPDPSPSPLTSAVHRKRRSRAIPADASSSPALGQGVSSPALAQGGGAGPAQGIIADAGTGSQVKSAIESANAGPAQYVEDNTTSLFFISQLICRFLCDFRSPWLMSLRSPTHLLSSLAHLSLTLCSFLSSFLLHATHMSSSFSFLQS